MFSNVVGRGTVLILLLIVTVLWPLQELSGGVLARNGHHLTQVVAFRYVAHLLLLVAIVVPRGGIRTFRTQRPGLQLLRGLCMFGMPAGYIAAAQFTSNAWIWTVFWLAPLLIVAGARLLLRERAPAAAWAGVVLGAIGAAAAMQASTGGLEGTTFALLMGGSFAGYVVLSRALRGESLAASLLYTAIGAVAPMALLSWRSWTPVQAADLVPALITGALSLLILGILDLVAEANPAWRIAVVLPIVVVWELLVAAYLRGAQLGTAALLGSCLIAVSALLAVRLLLMGHRGGKLTPSPASSVVDLHHG